MKNSIKYIFTVMILFIPIQTTVHAQNSPMDIKLLNYVQYKELPVKAIKSLIHKGANINAITKDGYTALFFLSRRGESELIEFFLANGANPNFTTKHGLTPVSFALQKLGLPTKQALSNIEKEKLLKVILIFIKAGTKRIPIYYAYQNIQLQTFLVINGVPPHDIGTDCEDEEKYNIYYADRYDTFSYSEWGKILKELFHKNRNNAKTRLNLKRYPYSGQHDPNLPFCAHKD